MGKGGRGRRGGRGGVVGGSGRRPWEMDVAQNEVLGRGGGLMGRVCVVRRPAVGRDDKGNDFSTRRTTIDIVVGLGWIDKASPRGRRDRNVGHVLSLLFIYFFFRDIFECKRHPFWLIIIF